MERNSDIPPSNEVNRAPEHNDEFDEEPQTTESASEMDNQHYIREHLARAATEILGEEVIASLNELELDDEDFLGAVYAELMSAGIDADEFLRQEGIVE